MQGCATPGIVATCVLLAMLVLPAGVASAASGWTEDMKAALAQAQKEGKDILVDFTGSDWCGWCIKLDKEVFSQEPFVTEAPKGFVLVKLDFPRERKMSDATKKQNNIWKRKLDIQGFPTIYLLDSQGRPYAKTGYRRGGPEKYVAHLKELQKERVKRDQMLAKAAKAEGLEKARLLDQVLSKIGGIAAINCYRDLVDEIIKLDAENKAGLKSKYELQVAQSVIRDLLADRKVAKALKKISGTIEQHKPTGQVSQDLWYLKAQLQFGKDKAASKVALDAALKAAPKGNKVRMIRAILKRHFPTT